MSIPSFSEFPEIPQRSAPEADFDAKMYALFQHFALTHRAEMLAFIDFLENNSTVIGGALNGTSIGLNTPAAAKFTVLALGDVVPLDDFHIASASPGFVLEDTDGGADEKYLRIRFDGGTFRLEGINDAFSSTSPGIVMTRSGRLIDTIGLYTGGDERLTVLPNGNVGIGMTPTRRLEVNGAFGAADNIYLERSSDDSFLKLQATSDGLFDINAYSDTPTSKAGIRMFRGTLTTGDVYLDILQGNDSTGVNHRLGGNTDSYLCNQNGKLSVGTATPYDKLTVWATEQSDGAAYLRNTNASFDHRLMSLWANRAGSSAFEFLRCVSNAGGTPDVETVIRADGVNTTDGTWAGGGADYAEYFEWEDGNPTNEDRRGVSVVLVGNKIRPALAQEVPFGVISANPSVIGDADIERWKEKYLRDYFGAYIKEDYEVIRWSETVTRVEVETVQETETVEQSKRVIEIVDGLAVQRVVIEAIEIPLFDEYPLFDEDGNELGIHRVPRMIEVEHEVEETVQHDYAHDEIPEGLTVPVDAERTTQQRRKLNPEYDPSLEYTPRAERPEWDTVGLMGKLRVLKGQPVGSRWIKMRDVSATVEEWLVL